MILPERDVGTKEFLTVVRHQSALTQQVFFLIYNRVRPFTSSSGAKSPPIISNAIFIRIKLHYKL